jgi:hypothetical protein
VAAMEMWPCGDGGNRMYLPELECGVLNLPSREKKEIAFFVIFLLIAEKQGGFEQMARKSIDLCFVFIQKYVKITVKGRK